MRKHLAALVLGLTLVVMSACQDKGADEASLRLVNAAAEPQNWLSHGATYDEQRYSALAQINADNVGELGMAWSFEFDTNRGQEATPLVVDGILYTTTAWSKVFALDGATGKEIWKYDPKVPGKAGYKGCCDVINRGVAYYDGMLFFGTLDGRLIALEAKTGKLLWSVLTVDQTKPYTISGAPRIVKGNVVIGNGGAEFGVRGYVTAYDAETGNQVWRFYTVPTDPGRGDDGTVSDEPLRKIAAPTWHGRFWEAGGGGTVWDSIVYDPELDQLYIGVGNGSPWNHRKRSEGRGDNLFLSSIVALDPDTGRYRWHYQETPGESWDFTATQQMILATLKIGGVARKVIMQAPKNGFFYVLDRTNGKLISAGKYVPVNWATGIDPRSGRPIEVAGARYATKPFLMMPGGAGGHNWQPMSFSPKTGLVYIPAQELPMIYEQDTKYRYDQAGQNVGINLNFAPLPTTSEERAAVTGSLKGRLLAWDPVAQKQVWTVEHKGAWNGGTLATAGDLVFQGTATGRFGAYHAATGHPLWNFEMPGGVMAGPISYAVKGTQYVAVLVGYGGAVGLALPEFGGSRPQPPGRIVVFRIGGKGRLPKFDVEPTPPNPPADVWPAAVVGKGETIYAYHCARCHGMGTLSAGVVPDLRRSATISDPAVWRDVVLGGLLEANGMVSFVKILQPDDAEAVRAYVVSQARLLKNEGNRRTKAKIPPVVPVSPGPTS